MKTVVLIRTRTFPPGNLIISLSSHYQSLATEALTQQEGIEEGEDREGHGVCCLRDWLTPSDGLQVCISNHANRQLLFYTARGSRAYCGHAMIVKLCSTCLILTVDSGWTRLGEMHDPGPGLLGAGH